MIAFTQEEKQVFEDDLAAVVVPQKYAENVGYIPKPIAPFDQCSMRATRKDGHAIWVMKRNGRLTFGTEPCNSD